MAAACWDGTIRLVRACLQPASGEEIDARRKGTSLCAHSKPGSHPKPVSVKGWSPQLLGPWAVRAGQVLVLGAASPHSGFLGAAAKLFDMKGLGMKGRSPKSLAAEPHARRSKSSGSESDAPGSSAVGLLERAAEASQDATEGIAGDTSSQTGMTARNGKGGELVKFSGLGVEEQLALVAEDFGLESLGSGAAAELAKARRRAAVAEAVGRGTNRAGGLLAAVPTRAAQAMAWDPVSASSGPIHAGGATAIAVSSMFSAAKSNVETGTTAGEADAVLLAVGDKSGALTAWRPHI